MTLSEILTEICSQLGDPEKEQYENRAKYHFIRAIFTLIDQKDFTQDDLPAYYKLKTNLSLSGGSADISSLDVFKILEIFPDPSSDVDVTVSLKSYADIVDIAGNDELKPAERDVFIYRVGNNLYALVNASSNFNLTSDTLYMIYLEDIDTSSWVNNTDLGSYFSNRFLTKAVAIAVQSLIAEDQLNT